MKDFLLYLWQLPQNLLGLFCIMFYKPIIKYYYEDDNGHKFVVYGQRILVSLSRLGSICSVFVIKKELFERLRYITNMDIRFKAGVLGGFT